MSTEYIELDQGEFKNSGKNYKKSALSRFNLKSSPETPPIRERVFNSELKDLAGNIIQHDPFKEPIDAAAIDESADYKSQTSLEKTVHSGIEGEIEISDDGFLQQESVQDSAEDIVEVSADIAPIVSEDEDEEIEDIVYTAIHDKGTEAEFETSAYSAEESSSIPHAGEEDRGSIIEDVFEDEIEDTAEDEIEGTAEDEIEGTAEDEIEGTAEDLASADENEEILNSQKFMKNNRVACEEVTETEPISVDLQDHFKYSDSPYPEKLFLSLLEHYKQENACDIKFDEILCTLQKYGNTSCFAVFGQDLMYNVYRVLTGRGLDTITQKNLFFSNRDIYLNREEAFELLKFKGLIAEDFNFKKRFSSDFLSKYAGALMVNLYRYNFPGWIAFFYRNFEHINADEIYANVEKLLPDLIPVFERYRLENFPKNPFAENNLYDRIVFSLNRMSLKGTQTVNIIYIMLNGYSRELPPKKFNKKWNDHLLSLMSHEDRLIQNGPERWIILSKTMKTETVMKHINKFCSKCGVSVTAKNIVYPDNGINVMNYIFAGARKK